MLTAPPDSLRGPTINLNTVMYITYNENPHDSISYHHGNRRTTLVKPYIEFHFSLEHSVKWVADTNKLSEAILTTYASLVTHTTYTI